MISFRLWLFLCFPPFATIDSLLFSFFLRFQLIIVSLLLNAMILLEFYRVGLMFSLHYLWKYQYSHLNSFSKFNLWIVYNLLTASIRIQALISCYCYLKSTLHSICIMLSDLIWENALFTQARGNYLVVWLLQSLLIVNSMQCCL